MKSYVVYTALFGNYDELRELSFKSNQCDYICFTDQNINSSTWKIVKLECDESNTILMNRKLKMLPHLYLTEYDSSIYIDTNIKLTRDVPSIFDKYLTNYGICIPSHFERACTYDEVDECIALGKISDIEGKNWKMFLEQERFPKKYGLGENNIIVRKHNDPCIIDLMEKWWEIFQNGLKRDQLSLMYLLWKWDVPFLFMKESSRNNNPYFKYYLHKVDSTLNPLKKLSIYVRARKNKNLYYYFFFRIIYYIKYIIKL